ncbi:hypothetical protein M406DRAFT_35082 [Cryphonectria parasitica EP155]|uniref:CWH43-like N-terminal domain-containing protein n=1 Tax=Cryphonectria parasitica (strain ATCC 38755 / EP155) TaxID=660469 RepID=A0A9P5CTU2_CRYP1|nr:uncharacterized protein M406DRAFT_35082 [Cryphonectria parasitica EP155]KAF3770703.1 hypothetical protein M406DRAFT_35082 [Cryphonectria parasitica EP155]
MMRLSYWVFPIIAGLVWLGMLLGLLLHWVIDTHSEHYPSMSANQHIAYISDVGAQELKPLFIVGCVLTTVLLDTSFLSDRWLRHRGRLVPNSTRGEKILSGLTIFCALIGTVGLILLSIFDTARHPRLHDLFLGFFIVGYLFSAIFVCWEYQRLGIRHPEHNILAVSFWIKLAFVLVTIALAIPFVVLTRYQIYNPAAVLEWIIALVFSFYVFSFYVDLYPAMDTKRGGNYRTRTWNARHQAHKPEEGASDRSMPHTHRRDLEDDAGLPSNF